MTLRISRGSVARLIPGIGWCLLALYAIALPSCARSDGRKPTFPVTGKILFDGKAADRALVIFHPVGDADPVAIKPRGQVAADGTFSLTTYEAMDGAPAGEYAVTVEWWLSPGKAGAGYDRPPTNRLPGKYSKAESSGLKVRIEPRQNELKPFELKR